VNKNRWSSKYSQLYLSCFTKQPLAVCAIQKKQLCNGPQYTVKWTIKGPYIIRKFRKEKQEQCYTHWMVGIHLHTYLLFLLSKSNVHASL